MFFLTRPVPRCSLPTVSDSLSSHELVGYAAKMLLKMKYVLVVGFWLSLTTSCFAADTLAVFPCPTKPVTGKDCLARTTPDGQTLNISNNDYYDASIESVCIDQPDSWWKKKIISMSATLTIGTGKPITTSIYQDRARGGGCRLGVNGYLLYSSVPSNGVPVTIQVGVIRSNEKNGLRQILAFATKQQSNPSLTTYVASAVPFVQLALGFANDLYSAFGETSVPEIPMSPIGLHPISNVHPDRFDLRDGYLVLYSGNDNPADGDVYVDRGELRWTKDDSLVRNGAVWVLMKIERHTKRTDYPTRNWYVSWTNLLNDVRSRKQIDSKTYKSRNQDCVTLLTADQDYTFGDKRAYIDAFNSVQDAIIGELDKTSPSYKDIDDAIDQALDDVEPIQQQKGGKVITATNTDKPTVIIAPQTTILNSGTQFLPPPPLAATDKAIVPSKLAEQLQRRLKKPM
jgi:hypothetical protein